MDMQFLPDETNQTADILHPLSARLRRIEGQIRGVTKMLEDDRECEDIITQILAVRSAIDKVAGEVIKIHVSRCLDVQDTIGAKNTIDRIISLMGKMN